ncbi:alpha/beta hydrolase [Arcanobacterium canis]
MNFSPRSAMLLALSLIFGIVFIVYAVRLLRRDHPFRAIASMILSVVLLLSSAAIQKNRVTQGPLTWGGVYATIWPKPLVGPTTPPLTKKEESAEGVISDTGEGWIEPKLAKGWGKAPNPAYQARLKQFHPEGANTKGDYFTTTWKGPQSQLTMEIIVWAPKGWRTMENLGVIEMLHGYPGGIKGVPAAMKFDHQMSELMSRNKIHPSVIVLPYLRPDGAETRALDVPGEPKVGTWAARDVPAMIAHTFPVSRKKEMWTLAGVSEGGYTAPALAVLARDTFGSAVSLSGTNTPEYGPLAKVEPSQVARVSLTSLLPKAPKMNVYAYSGGNEPKSNKLLAQLSHLGKRPGVTTLVRDTGRGHGWVTWKHAFAGMVEWIGNVQRHQAESTIDASVKESPAAASADVEKNMHGIVSVTSIVSVLALAYFVWRVWFWRRRSIVQRSANAYPRSGGSPSPTSARRFGAIVARLMVWDVVAVVFMTLTVFVWAVLALNLWGQWLRSEEDILGLLVQLGLPYDG